MPLCDKNTNISWKKPPIGFVSLENTNTILRINTNGHANIVYCMKKKVYLTMLEFMFDINYFLKYNLICTYKGEKPYGYGKNL